MDRLWQAVMIVAYRLAKVYWFVRRPEARGAHVAIWHENRLLIIRNSYKRAYSLVCGGVKSGENSIEAAIREVREEVGLQLSQEQLTHVGQFLSRQEYKYDCCEIYNVTLTEPPEIQIDNREVIEYQLLTIDEVVKLPQVDQLRQYLATCKEQLR